MNLRTRTDQAELAADNYPPGVSIADPDAPWNWPSKGKWECVNPRCPQADIDWRGRFIGWQWWGEDCHCPECGEQGVPLPR
jgi:hypothetical protein